MKALFAALLMVAVSGGAAGAQSLSPMHNSGTTPSDTKGFKLFVGNPYKQKMTFQVIPMDPKFRVAAADAQSTSPRSRWRRARRAR